MRKKEKVTYVKIHRFTGSIKTRPKIKSDPEWMKDPVSIPVVTKVCSAWMPAKETDLAAYVGD